jgi:Asp-tRNA(Asn)/Glu-tRNA(Gln) amidotransferase B subunit
MLAQSDVNLKEAAETVYVISQDELIREQMIAREDNIRSEKAMKKHYEDLMEEARLDKIRSENAMKKHYEDIIADQQRQIEELKAALANK